MNATYSDGVHKLMSLKIDGVESLNEEHYTICLQGYHVNNAKPYLDITEEELLASGKSRVISTSAQEVLEEFLRNNQNLKRNIKGRLVYIP